MDSNLSSTTTTYTNAIPRRRLSRHESSSVASTTAPLAGSVRLNFNDDAPSYNPPIVLSSEGEFDSHPDRPHSQGSKYTLKDIMARMESTRTQPATTNASNSQENAKLNYASLIHDSDLDSVLSMPDPPLRRSSARDALDNIFQRALQRPGGSSLRHEPKRRLSMEDLVQGSSDEHHPKRKSLSDDNVSVTLSARPLSRAESFDLIKAELDSSMMRSALHHPTSSHKPRTELSIYDRTPDSIHSADIQSTSTPPRAKPATSMSDLRSYIDNAVSDSNHSQRFDSETEPETSVQPRTKHSGELISTDASYKWKYNSTFVAKDVKTKHSPVHHSTAQTNSHTLSSSANHLGLHAPSPRPKLFKPATSTGSSRLPAGEDLNTVDSMSNQKTKKAGSSLRAAHVNANDHNEKSEEKSRRSSTLHSHRSSDAEPQHHQHAHLVDSLANHAHESKSGQGISTDSNRTSQSSKQHIHNEHITPTRHSTHDDEEEEEEHLRERNWNSHKPNWSHSQSIHNAKGGHHNFEHETSGTETEREDKEPRHSPERGTPMKSSKQEKHHLLKTPKPPGSWMSPHPATELMGTSEDAQPSTMLHREPHTTSITGTPAPPGGWSATPATKKGILKVRSVRFGDHSHEPDASTHNETQPLNKSLQASIASTSKLEPTPSDADVDTETGDDSCNQGGLSTVKPLLSRGSKLRVVDAMGIEVMRDRSIVSPLKGPSESVTKPDPAVNSDTSLIGRIKKKLADIRQDFPPTPNTSLSTIQVDSEDDKLGQRAASTTRTSVERSHVGRRLEILQNQEDDLMIKLAKLRKSYLESDAALLTSQPSNPVPTSKSSSPSIRNMFMFQVIVGMLVFWIFTRRIATNFQTIYYDPLFPALYIHPKHQSLASGAVGATMRHMSLTSSWKQMPTALWNYLMQSFWEWWRGGGWEQWTSSRDAQWVPT